MKNFQVMTQNEMENVNGGMIRLLKYFFKFIRLLPLPFRSFRF